MKNLSDVVIKNYLYDIDIDFSDTIQDFQEKISILLYKFQEEQHCIHTGDIIIYSDQIPLKYLLFEKTAENNQIIIKEKIMAIQKPFFNKFIDF